MDGSFLRRGWEGRKSRVRASRAPVVESLEGRQLLTSLSSPKVPPFNNPAYSITAKVSPTDDPSGLNSVFKPEVTITGQAQPYSTVWLAQGDRGYFTNVAPADPNGFYSITITVPKGRSEVRVFSKNVALQYSQETKLEVTRGNPILAWDAIALGAIAQANLSGPEAARSLAILHLAQYDAVAAIQSPKGAYGVHIAAPKGASPEAAANAAAKTVLDSLFPTQVATFDRAMKQANEGVKKNAATRNGSDVGVKVAQATLVSRLDDGSSTMTGHPGSNLPGIWRPTAPDFLPAQDPDWGMVKPFLLQSGSQFRPPAPPMVGSDAYDQALAQVTLLGQAGSTARTPGQTGAAFHWADGANTVTNPGHWNSIAQDIAVNRKGTLAQDARLFAMLDVAMADAGIAAFDAKYAYSAWRPISAIQQTDPTWAPQITTPPSPSYVSANATFAAAASKVLTAAFGSKVKFTDNLYSAVGDQPTYTSFAAAATEDAQSRVWAGTNFSYDVQQGLALGDKIGGFVVTRFPGGR